MFRNKTINMIFSLLAAVFLWFFVVGQVNPQTTTTIKDIPVTFTGEQALNDNDLALVDPGELLVDVTVKGNRADVKRLEHSQVTVTADVSQLGKGKNTVALSINVPKSVELDEASMEEVVLTVDALYSKEMDVTVVFQGQFDEDTTAGDPIVSPTSVTVTGAKETVESIQTLQAVVTLAELEEGTTFFTKEIVPVSKNALPVGHVRLSADTVNIETALVHIKAVDLEVTAKGKPDGGEVNSIDAPDSVTVTGPRDKLENLTKVTAEVDVSGLTKSGECPLTIDLPEGVELSGESEKLTKVQVNLEKQYSNELTIKSSDVAVDNLYDGLTATKEDTDITVVVSGKKELVDSIKAGDITLSVDASGLWAGEHELTLIVKSKKTDGDYSAEPETIKITIQ